ncbi:MAG: hypothetical protein AAGH99_00640 [Planctomycetota bacterium]
MTGAICLGGALTGCDDQLAETAKARAALDEAIALFEEAEQGYVTGEAAGGYDGFRVSKLAEAEAKLQTVADRSNDPLAKAGAIRLIAGVKASRARDTAEQAAAAFAEINRQSTGLFNQLAAAQHINALIVARTGDGGAIVKALEEGLTLIRESKAGVNSAIAEISVQRESATLSAEQFNTQAASHLTRAQEFEEQARVAPNGEVEQQIITQGYTAQLDAQSAQRAAREQEIEAQLAGDRIDSLKAEIEIWDKMAQQLTELKQRVEADGADAARDVNAAGSERGLALTDLEQQIDSFASRFESDVNAPLAAAAQEVAESIEQLGRANGLAGRDERQAVSFEQVSTKVEYAALLSRHAGFARDFAHLLGTILQNPVVAESVSADLIQDEQLRFADQADKLKQQAQIVITDGLAQAEPMIGPNETGQAAQSLAQALRSYGDQLN